MPKIQLPEKFEHIITAKQRLIVLVGGRSSGKSEGIGRLLLQRSQTEAADILCGREYQNSIEESCHKLLKALIDKLEVKGANITKNSIDFITGGGFRYKGFSRSPEAVKSAQGFKYSWIEEAQTISQQTIDDLIPTIRSGNSQLFFTANPRFSTDPFSKRFINPFSHELSKNGYYSDDMHLVLKMNWNDNPWHKELEDQRKWDYEHMTRSKYNHIWEGEFMDESEDAIIPAEWFDAAIDAHEKLGFEPIGQKVVGFDPADEGGDGKGFTIRQGSVVLDVCEHQSGDIHDALYWALEKTVNERADLFSWDCDGMGVVLKKPVVEYLRGKKIDYHMFKGSESPDYPDQVYQKTDDGGGHRKTNKQTFRNKRSQYIWILRDKFYETFLAVEKGKYIDPDNLISISSKIESINLLREQVCRLQLKRNDRGLIQIMSKAENFSESPNMLDSLVYSQVSPIIRRKKQISMTEAVNFYG